MQGVYYPPELKPAEQSFSLGVIKEDITLGIPDVIDQSLEFTDSSFDNLQEALLKNTDAIVLSNETITIGGKGGTKIIWKEIAAKYRTPVVAYDYLVPENSGTFLIHILTRGENPELEFLLDLLISTIRFK